MIPLLMLICVHVLRNTYVAGSKDTTTASLSTDASGSSNAMVTTGPITGSSGSKYTTTTSIISGSNATVVANLTTHGLSVSETTTVTSACSSPCPLNCSECACVSGSWICDDPCPEGWWGPDCTELCPQAKCSSGSCAKSDGSCLECESGWYGPSCSQQCGHCLDGKCNSSNGFCTPCKPGYYSKTCFLRCSVGCANNQTCYQDSGICTDGCKPSYYGMFCRTQPCGPYCVDCNVGSGWCRKCTSGYSGIHCHKCPATCFQGTCDLDGVCYECPSGMYKMLCQVPCPGSCSGSCNKTTGECLAECLHGWTGPTCQVPRGPDRRIIIAGSVTAVLLLLVLVASLVVHHVHRNMRAVIATDPNVELKPVNDPNQAQAVV